MMLFLKLLFFASTFYFTYARPEAPFNDPEPINQPTVPGRNSTEQDFYEQALQDFIKDCDQHLTLILSLLNVKKQEEFKDMTLNVMASNVNYMVLEALKSKYDGSLSPNEKNIWDNNEIIIEFDGLDAWASGSPYISEISAD